MNVSKRMKDLITKLSPLRMAPNSAGLDKCTEFLCQELDFNIIEVEGGSEINGWIVPQKWEINRATIKNANGDLIYDGMHHPLAVIGYSQSFSGKISGKELKQHLFYSGVFDDALIYHCDLFYKPFKKEWGFSVTKIFFDSIDENATYDVDLSTSFESGTMKISEYTLPGESTDTIVINAHNCHAFCCNDDLSGIAVGIEAMREMAKLPNRHYTYKLIVAPEHFGSIFYLEGLTDEQANQLKGGFFLESVGAGGPLNLQRSFEGNTVIDRAFLNALEYGTEKWVTHPFRKVIGNDETCWEAAGYDIPFPSLSRCYGDIKFPEYHTSKDSPDLMDEGMLQETLDVVLQTLMILEKDSTLTRQFKGLVALSHPKHDLYFPMTDPSKHDREEIDHMALRWNYLMDCLPRYFDQKTRLLQIAERFEVPFDAVYDYVKKFEQKDLVTMQKAESMFASDQPLPPR